MKQKKEMEKKYRRKLREELELIELKKNKKSLERKKEVYQKIQPNFYVHFSFNTKDNNKMFAVFFGNIYNNGVHTWKGII